MSGVHLVLSPLEVEQVDMWPPLRYMAITCTLARHGQLLGGQQRAAALLQRLQAKQVGLARDRAHPPAEASTHR